MRSAPIVLALLALVACSPDPVAGPTPGPTGPCAAERSQPPDGSQEQRLQGDLDGDGRTDEVVSWVRDGERVAQAWLATGENAVPEALFSGELLAVADLDEDRRDEVLAVVSGTTGGAFALDGCRLVRLALAVNDRPWEFATGPGTALTCRPRGVVEEAVTQGPETVRRAWTVAGTDVTGANPVGTGPVASPGISCG